MLCHWFNISRLLHQFQVCNPAHLWFCKTKGCKRPKCFPITATLLLFLLNCFECVRVCVWGGFSHNLYIKLLYMIHASSPDCRLGYWAIQQGAETSIQPPEPMVLHSQLHAVTCKYTACPRVSRPAQDQLHMYVPVTYQSLCIAAGLLLHLAAAGSWHTL